MRIYYQVCFTRGNHAMIKRFNDLAAASALCDRTGGVIRICREKIHVDWKAVAA